MSDDDSTGKSTNGSLLRELRQESRDHGNLLAGLAAQMAAQTELLKSIQAEQTTATGRHQALERDAVAMRERLSALESRPLAMNERERAEMQGQIKTMAKQGDTNDRGLHDLRNIVQSIKTSPPLFSAAEVEDTKRYLEIGRRRNVDDAFTPDETDRLRFLLATDSSRRQGRTDVVRLLQGAVGGAIVSGLIQGGLFPAIAHLFH